MEIGLKKNYTKYPETKSSLGQFFPQFLKNTSEMMKNDITVVGESKRVDCLVMKRLYKLTIYVKFVSMEIPVRNRTRDYLIEQLN